MCVLCLIGYMFLGLVFTSSTLTRDLYHH